MPRPLASNTPTPKQDQILTALRRKALTCAEIADLTGMAPKTVGTLLGILSGKGLIQAEPKQRAQGAPPRWSVVTEPKEEQPHTDPITRRVESLINAVTSGTSREQVADILEIEIHKATWALRHLLRNDRITARTVNGEILYHRIPKVVAPVAHEIPVSGATQTRYAANYVGHGEPYRRAPSNSQPSVGGLFLKGE